MIRSRFMVLTRDTSRPASEMLEGIRSIPSCWRIRTSVSETGPSLTVAFSRSVNVSSRSSGCGYPRLIVREAWGSASINRTLFPCLASAMPRFSTVVVLPTLCEASHKTGYGKLQIMQSSLPKVLVLLRFPID